jgi:hypothetical protein
MIPETLNGPNEMGTDFQPLQVPPITMFVKIQHHDMLHVYTCKQV